MNIHWIKYPVILEVAFESCIFLVCWFFFTFLVLNLVISECLDQIPPLKEIKEAFSVKLRIENLFLPKLKIKQNPGISICSK